MSGREGLRRRLSNPQPSSSGGISAAISNANSRKTITPSGSVDHRVKTGIDGKKVCGNEDAIYICQSLAELGYTKDVTVKYLQHITAKNYNDICWFLLEKLVGTVNRPRAGYEELKYIKEKVVSLGFPHVVQISQLITPYWASSRPFAYSLLSWLCKRALAVPLPVQSRRTGMCLERDSSSEESVGSELRVTKSGFPDMRTKVGRDWMLDQVLNSEGEIPGWVEKRVGNVRLSSVSQAFYKIYDRVYPVRRGVQLGGNRGSISDVH